jgi:hypothetical protein
MPDVQRVQALHHALTGRLKAGMTAAGWYPDPTGIVGIGDGVVGHFRHPLNEDFAVTAWFAWLGDYPPLQLDTVVGLSYERTYRVWPYFLNGYPHSELRVGVENLGQDAPLVELWELDDLDWAVEELVGPVLDHAIRWAEPRAGVVELLAHLLGSDDPDAVLMDTPVVLAGAGALVSARDALADAKRRALADEDVGEQLFMENFSPKFETWLASGAPPTFPK